ncbi:zinc-binding dehydrogenase [Spongiactinospora sp. 9N601]|uniref:zinc-binding dehydrogenase n=1 Tax=Spongiactinospora sp. 9N601 TaxID=3375149 RepID=UPI0037A60F98
MTPNETRLSLAAALGLLTWDARSPTLEDEIRAHSPGGVDLVVETSGAWGGLDTAARLCRTGGRVSVLGV